MRYAVNPSIPKRGEGTAFLNREEDARGWEKADTELGVRRSTEAEHEPLLPTHVVGVVVHTA
jgi:hypothetical protein